MGRKKKPPTPPTDAEQAELAYLRANAWALSPVGTPYGSTTPTHTPKDK